MNPYPIYVISLKRTPERRLNIQRQLDALNLNYQIVDAIDKYDLKSPQYQAEVADLLGIDKTIIEKSNTHYFYDHLACSLSHVKVYNLMAKHNDSIACILEDDARIASDFPKILHATMRTSWDILMFSSQSQTIWYMLATNPNIQKEMEKMPEIDCSLFSKLKRVKWFKRILPPAPTSRNQLDWTFIPKFHWWLLMLLSSSRTAYILFKYFISAYKYLLAFYNPDHHILYRNKEGAIRVYAACQIGGLPVRPSQQTLYKGYDMAIPAERMTSGMAYLLTSAAANKCKEVVNSEYRILIDSIPWHLHKQGDIKLRILTPPCVTASFRYLKNSARNSHKKGKYVFLSTSTEMINK